MSAFRGLVGGQGNSSIQFDQKLSRKNNIYAVHFGHEAIVVVVYLPANNKQAQKKIQIHRYKDTEEEAACQDECC